MTQDPNEVLDKIFSDLTTAYKVDMLIEEFDALAREAKQTILDKFISRQSVAEAIGKDETHSNCECAYQHRNQLRAQLRQSLLKGDKDE